MQTINRFKRVLNTPGVTTSVLCGPGRPASFQHFHKGRGPLGQMVLSVASEGNHCISLNSAFFNQKSFVCLIVGNPSLNQYMQVSPRVVSLWQCLLPEWFTLITLHCFWFLEELWEYSPLALHSIAGPQWYINLMLCGPQWYWTGLQYWHWLFSVCVYCQHTLNRFS